MGAAGVPVHLGQRRLAAGAVSNSAIDISRAMLLRRPCRTSATSVAVAASEPTVDRRLSHHASPLVARFASR